MPGELDKVKNPCGLGDFTWYSPLSIKHRRQGFFNFFDFRELELPQKLLFFIYFFFYYVASKLIAFVCRAERPQRMSERETASL